MTYSSAAIIAMQYRKQYRAIIADKVIQKGLKNGILPQPGIVVIDIMHVLMNNIVVF